ncbi:MAG: EAL domain-containing protein [Capsulimonadaceae bacterium]|nr:EAL domain-containing protein [Capsulimonadaceae bacterium]
MDTRSKDCVDCNAPLLPLKPSPWTLLGYVGACAATALVLGSIVVTMYASADRARVEQIALNRLKSEVCALSSIEETARANRGISPTLRNEHIGRMGEIRATFASIRRSSPRSASVSQLGVALSDYELSIARQMRLIEDGDADAAAELLSSNADPLFHSAADQIDAQIRRSGRWAKKAQSAADIVTWSGLAIGALLTAFLLWRRQLSQQSLGRMALEKNMISRSERRFNALVRHGSDITVVVGSNREIIYVSPAVAHVLGYDPAELIGIPGYEFIHSDERSHITTVIDQIRAAKPDSSTMMEARVRNASGQWRLFEFVITNMLDEPEVEGILLNCRDISERSEFQIQLAHLALHDTLTGLPNRALFMSHVARALDRSRTKLSSIAVLCINIDDFKLVNDSLGHDAGDILLVQLARRLQECVRLLDAISRIGGDQFTVLLEDQADDDVRAIAQKIMAALWTPIVVETREVFVSVTIGVAIASGEYASADELLRDAETAMYNAKAAGKSRVVVFEQGMNARALEKLDLQTDLNRALKKKQFEIYYQPVVSLADGCVTEVEALLRWNHPTRGLVLPDQFIPIAEQTGLIVPLGQWTLEQACRQARQWQIDRIGQSPIGVNVNISPRQLLQPDFLDKVRRVLKTTGLAGELLTLEITESFMIQDTEPVIPMLHDLKKLGVKLAIDDFGTGYSSMAYICTLPIDSLKIDRSFITKLGEQDDDAVIGAIVTLAKALRIEITSEGIETEEQLTALQEIGCDNGQGFFLSPPLPPDKLTSVLMRSRKLSLVTNRAAKPSDADDGEMLRIA